VKSYILATSKLPDRLLTLAKDYDRKNGISEVFYESRYDQWVVILTPFLKPSKTG